MKRAHADPSKGGANASRHGGERLILAGLCVMVCAVPLAIWPGVFKYALLPKLLALHACVSVCCLGWLRTTGWGGNVGWTRSPLTLPALLWMGIGLIASLSTTHPLDTAVEWLNQAVLVVLMFVAASALPLRRLSPVLWAGAATGMVVGIFGILQYHSLDVISIPANAPPAVTFANRNLAAEYLICALPLSGLLFVMSRRGWERAVSGLSACLMGVYLVYTRTRGAWVGMAGAVVCVGLAVWVWPELRRSVGGEMRARMDRSATRWAIAFCLLFLTLASLPPRQSVLPESKSDAASTAASVFQKDTLEEDAGIRDRLSFWRATLRMVSDHPVLGVGPGGWVRAYPPYDGGETLRTGTVLNSPHNDYLWVASEYGLIGLGAYAWLLVAGLGCLLRMARSPDPSCRTAAPWFALSVLAILGDACFSFPRSQPQAMMFLFLLFGVAAGATGPHPPHAPPSPTRRDRQRKLSEGGEGRGLPSAVPVLSGVEGCRLPSLLFLLISLTATVFSWQRIGFDRHYRNALARGVARDWPALLSEIQDALDCGVFRPQALYVKNVALQNLGRTAEAEEACRQALVYTPHDWRLHAGLSSLLLRSGRPQDALAHAQTALSLCPGAVFLRKNLAEIFRRMGDLPRAEQELQAVLRAFPGDAEACQGLGDVRYVQGKYREALNAYRTCLGLVQRDTAAVRRVGERISACEERLK